MIQKRDIKNQIAALLERKASLSAFERWLGSESWNMFNESPDAISLVAAVNMLLAELHDAVIDSELFHSELRSLVNNVVISEQREAETKGEPMNAHGLVRNFLLRLPHGIRCPAIIVEEDGDLGFDWDTGHRTVISASLREDGRVAWAAMIGDWKGHGHFTLPAWSDEFTEALTKYVTALQQGDIA